MPKLSDPGAITLTCTIKTHTFPTCLVDTGASVNTISVEACQHLGIFEYKPCFYKIRLADRSLTEPLGIIKDVLVHVGGVEIPTDFAVLKVPIDRDGPMLLGRPFLASAKAVIDVANGKVELNLGKGKDMLVDALGDGKRIMPPGLRGSTPTLRFWLEPSEREDGEVEYTVRGGKIPLPHEYLSRNNMDSSGPFSIGRKTDKGTIAMMGFSGTKLPYSGQKVKLHLVPAERTPSPLTPTFD